MFKLFIYKWELIQTEQNIPSEITVVVTESLKILGPHCTDLFSLKTGFVFALYHSVLFRIASVEEFIDFFG